MGYLDKITNGNKPPVTAPPKGSYYDKIDGNQPERAQHTLAGNSGVGKSDYDYQVTPDSLPYLDEIRGQVQSSAAKLGSGFVNAITQTATDILKDASYLLDYENYTDFKKSSEEGFNNWLADAMTSVQEKLKLPVYRTRESEGFSPTSAGWWGESMPSIASTVAMMFPAEAAVMGLSKLGKVVGGARVIKGIEEAANITGLASNIEGVTGAVLSRQMENILEGAQTFEATKAELKQKHPEMSDDQVNQIAGEAAANNYKLNWVNLATDIPQYALLHKSFKQAIADKKFKTSELLKTMGQESAEEAYQFITNEEAKRSALVNAGVIEDDSNFGERLAKYAKDGELWSAAFLGGLGGGLFGGVAAYKNNRNLPKLQSQYETIAKMHTAILKGDKESFNRASDNLFSKELMSHAQNGTLDEFSSMLDKTLELPEDRTEVAELRTKVRDRQKAIEFAKEYSDKLAGDPTKSSTLKALELDAAVTQKLVADRLKNIDNEFNKLSMEDRQLIKSDDPNLYRLKIAKIELEAIQGIPATSLDAESMGVLKNKATALAKNIEEMSNMFIQSGVFDSLEDIAKTLTTANDKELVNLMRNANIDEHVAKNAKDTLYKVNSPEHREELEKTIVESQKKFEKAQEEARKAAEKQAKEEAKVAEEQADTEEAENGVADLMAKAAQKAAEDISDEEFTDFIDNGNVSNQRLRNIANKVKARTQLSEKETAVFNSKTKEINDIIAESTKETTTGAQDIVSEFTSLTTNVEGSEQSTLSKDSNNLISVEINNGVNKRNNAVMMRLYDHDTKSGRFVFRRDEEGFPIRHNDSGIDEKELNNLREGDELEIRITPITDAAKVLYNARKAKSIADGALPSDFDGEHLGIYSNDKLIGFVQQPHINSNALNQDEANELRQELIENRREIVKNLKAGHKVVEKVDEKGDGNLYTKLRKDGRIDLVRNVLDDKTSRDIDLVDGIRVFVYSDGESLHLPEPSISDDNREEIEKVLVNYSNYGKSGQIFQLVKGLTGRWALIPVYPSKINDTTSKLIIDAIGTYSDATPLEDIVAGLNPYVYISTYRSGASMLVNNIGGQTVFQLDVLRNAEGDIVSSDRFTLNEIKSNKVRRDQFIALLKSKNQNISIIDINNEIQQGLLNARGTLMTNVVEDPNGEYFIQPYVSYTKGGKTRNETLSEANDDYEDPDEPVNDKQSRGTDTEDKPISLNDIFGKIDPNTSMEDEDALSTKRDKTPLNRPELLAWVKKNLPQLTLSDITNIADLKANLVDAYGLYRDLTIYLFDGAGQATGYHEAFHGVFRNLLSLNEKYDLLDDAMKTFPEPTVEELKSLQQGLDSVYSTKQLRYLYYEEKLADAFADWMTTYGNPSIGQRILNFFKKLLDMFNLFTKHPQDRVEQLFKAINSGQFKSREVQSNKPKDVTVFNRDLQIFNEAAYNKKLDFVFGVARKSRIIESVGNQFIAYFQREVYAGKPEYRIDANSVYNKVLKHYQDYLVQAGKDMQDPNKKGSVNPKFVEEARRVEMEWETIKSEVNKFLGHRNIKFTKGKIERTGGINPEEINEDNSATADSQEFERGDRSTKGFAEITSISGMSSASQRMKIFLSSIPVLDTKGKVKKDPFKLEQFYDFSKVYYYIEEKLTGLYTLDEQLAKLKKLSKVRPELKQVVDKLTIRPQHMTEEEFRNLRNDFKTNFSKQHIPFTLVKFDTDSLTGQVTYRIIDANRTQLSLMTKDQWSSNYIDITRRTVAKHNDDGSVTEFGTTEAKSLLRDWKELIKKPLKQDVVARKLYKLGIEISPEALVDEYDTVAFKKAVENIMEWRATSPPDQLKKEQAAREAIDLLVSYEVNSQVRTYTSSFNDVENKNIYTIQLPSYASKLLAKLTGDPVKFKNAYNDLTRDPMYRHSNLLNLMRDSNEFRRGEFSMSMLDGLKDDRGDAEGSKFVNMQPRDYLAMQIALFQNSYANAQNVTSAKTHKYVYIVPSDKSLAMIFQSRKFSLILDGKERVRKINKNSDILNNYYNIFLMEAARIKNNLDIKNDLISKGNDSKYLLADLMQYNHFSKATWGTISKLAEKQLSGDKLTAEEWETVSNSFDGNGFSWKYFSKGFDNYCQQFTKVLESTNQDNLASSFESIKDPIINAMLPELNTEIDRVRGELIEENIIQWNEEKQVYENVSLELKADPKDLQAVNDEIHQLIAEYALNSKLHNIELSNLLNGDFAQYKPDDLQKRTYQSGSTYTNGNNSETKVGCIVKKDVEIKEPYPSEMIAALQKIGLKESSIDFIVNKYGHTTPWQEAMLKDPKVDKRDKARILRGIKDINVTDAQVYVTPEFYKQFLIDHGRWDSAMQEAYDIAEGLSNPKEIDKSLRVLLGGIKPFYFGSRFDEKLGIHRFEQVKCAMIPLFKSYTDMNPLLAHKRQEMKAANAPIMAHESAFKAAIGFRSSIDSNVNNVLELDLGSFGIQVDNPEHIQDSQNDSLRQLKMLILGSTDDNKLYKGVKGSDIKKRIMLNEAKNIRESLLELSNELELTNNGKFAEFIRDMVTKRGATINVTEILDIINGSFKYPLDNGNLSKQIENLISSLYTSNVIKQPFGVGGNGVQATSLGFKFSGANLLEQQDFLDADLLKEQGTLKWIKPDVDKGEVGYAQCAMPAWTEKYFDKFGFLKNIDDIPEELKQLIMYRIPTEGLHSMLPIKVVKFLPETLGNFILLPYQVTTQFGADFDFDKMFFIGREFYEDPSTGKLKAYKETKDTRANYLQYYEFQKTKGIKPLTYSEYKDIHPDEQAVRPMRNNAIIDDYLHLLTSIENYGLMVTPSGFDELTEINEFFKDENLDKPDFFSSATQRDYKNRNHVTRALKGMWSLHVTGHAAASQMPLTTEARFQSGKLDRTKTINFNGLAGTLDKLYNFGGEDIGFTKMYTLKGQLICDKISSVQAAALDDIKNPIIKALGIDKNTTDVAATIVRAGFDLNTAVMFVAQPGIKQLSSNIAKNYAKLRVPGQRQTTAKQLLAEYRAEMHHYLEAVAKKDAKKDTHEASNPDLLRLVDLADEKFSDITDNELESYLSKYKSANALEKASNIEKVKYYAFQARVIQQFINISPIADAIKDINNFFSINKEVGPNVENIIGKVELLEKIEKSKVIKGFDLSHVPQLEATWEAHEDALEYFKEYFPYASTYYMDAKKHAVSIQSNRTLNDIKIDRRIYMNNFIRTYMDHMSKRYKGFKNDANYKKLFVTLPSILKDINNPANAHLAYAEKKGEEGVKFADIRNNLFIQNIYPKYDKKNLTSTIMLKNGRLDTMVKDNVITAFNKLYNNRHTKELAEALIDHSFANSGFSSGLRTYSDLIPVEILDQIGYYDHRRKMIDAVNDVNNAMVLDDVSKDRLVDQMIRNFPKAFTKAPFDMTMFHEFKDGQALPKIISTDFDLVAASGRLDDIILEFEKEGSAVDITKRAKYIRIFDKVHKTDTLYRAIGTNEDMKYERICKLGKKGFALEVDPYNDLDVSFFRENNIDKGTILPADQRAKKTDVDEESDNFQDSANEGSEPETDSELTDILNGEVTDPTSEELGLKPDEKAINLDEMFDDTNTTSDKQDTKDFVNLSDMFGDNFNKSNVRWARKDSNGYEISSRGDSRFSALTAKLKDGRTIEEAYQLDIKGYRSKGNDWRLGKGKAPLISMTKEQSWEAYKSLWKQWSLENPELINELRSKVGVNGILTDMFANTEISQARALAEIINESRPNKEATPQDKAKEYQIYSGGAIGSDTYWAVTARKYGVGKVRNYFPADLAKLTPEQMAEVEGEYQKVVKQLNRQPLAANTYAGGLVRRDYLQAKAGDAIFAIVEGFDRAGMPMGGTAYAIVTGLNMRKPVHVFSQKNEKWYKGEFDSSGVPKWVEIDTPVLTKKFTGVGTRKLTRSGEKAIIAVFDKTFAPDIEKC